jgi:hypothetical protein
MQGESMKIRKSILVACSVSFALALLFVPFRQLTFGQTPAVIPVTANVNTVSLNFTYAQVDQSEGGMVVRAFVPTGSKSGNCLASLNEIRSNSWPAGVSIYCAEREPVGFGGVAGILVSVFFSQPAPTDFAVSVTLYQQGAKQYGTPVLCTANDGC